MNPSPIFSNQDYYENPNFRRHHAKFLKLDNSSKYTQLEKDNYREIIMFDLYRDSIFWFALHKKAHWWREGLE